MAALGRHRSPKLARGASRYNRMCNAAVAQVHARGDKARVAPLVAAIEAQGWSVWWDPEICRRSRVRRQIAAELKIG